VNDNEKIKEEKMKSLTLTPAQREEALRKAAEAAKIRADLKADIRNGKKTFADVVNLAKTNSIIGHIKVLTIIESIPGISTVSANEILTQAKVDEKRSLVGLSSKQVAILLELLK
jgi:hypothetical protein